MSNYQLFLQLNAHLFNLFSENNVFLRELKCDNGHGVCNAEYYSGESGELSEIKFEVSANAAKVFVTFFVSRQKPKHALGCNEFVKRGDFDFLKTPDSAELKTWFDEMLSSQTKKKTKKAKTPEKKSKASKKAK